MAEQKNILDMSDEELENMSIPSDEPVNDTPTEEEANDATETAITGSDETDLDGEPSTDDSDSSDDATDEEQIGDTEDATTTTDDSDSDDLPSKEEDKTSTDDDDPKEEEVVDNSEIDYKSEYEKILAPFKANGKTLQVNSVDDALTLMKMGANYNKKMAGLKPSLKIVKMLDNNDLLDEGKLSYLIDLSKKNPDAVKKLIKESGIDPLDIDEEQATDYTPKSYTVNDKEVELDEVLDNIRDTDSYKDTIDILSNKWDESSKKVLLATPGLISTINEHVGLGIYAQIDTVVQSERMLGRLQGLSDLEAYKKIGDQLQAQGKFGEPEAQQKPVANVADKTISKKPDPKLKNRKKAASSTRTTPGKKANVDGFNPLNLSDEEFAKLAEENFK